MPNWKHYAVDTMTLDIENGRIFRITDPVVGEVSHVSYVYVPNAQVEGLQVEAPRRMCAQCGRSYPTQRQADVCATMQHLPATDDLSTPQQG